MIATGSVEELRRLALDDPARARSEAAEVIAAATSVSDLATVADASVALVRACLTLGDIDAAGEAARRGTEAAAAADLVDIGREIGRLHVGVLTEQGRADEALTEVRRLVDGAPPAELGALALLRATVLQVAGRMAEARVAFDEAIPELERVGDDLRAAMAHANRANTFRTLGDLDGAEVDLRRAGERFAALGVAHAERTARVHLAALFAGRGRVADALGELEKVRTDDPAFALDEGHVLLDAHLLDEAGAVFRRAADGFAGQNQRNYAGAALVEQARVALLRGEADEARGAASRAIELVEGSSGHAAEALSLLTLAEAPDAVGAADVEALERAGRTEAADAIRVRAALEAERSGRVEAVGHLVGPVVVRSGSGLRHRLRQHLASALLASAEGRRGAARRSVTAGLSLLARHQAALGAVDLRAEAQGHGEALAALGLRLAAERRAIDLLVTSERCRAGTSRLPRPPVIDDAELSALLARLRAAQRRLDELDPLDDDRDRVRREIVSLERAVATRRRLRPGSGGRPTTVDERRLREASHRCALISFVEVDGELVRLDLVAGRCRRRHLGPIDEVVASIGGVTRAMARLADRRVRPAMAAALRGAVDHDAAVLTDRLLADLPGALPVVLVPTGPLHGVPWAALAPLRERPFVLAASLTGWLDAEARSDARDVEGACVVAGPDLAEADDEVHAVAALVDLAAVLTGAAAVGPDVAEALRGVRIAHLATHGRFRVDNPLLSGVVLDDGVLTVHDLEGSAPTPPVVVLSACDLARSVVRPGDELLGLAAGLFALGTDTLVAATVPVPDGSTRRLMESFHRRLAADSVAAALAGARAELLDGEASSADLVAALAFCVVGAGIGPS
ncbi:MAG: CHAT domain-containing protein [Actinomycetota bacterium]